jgi:hypothetical protein
VTAVSPEGGAAMELSGIELSGMELSGDDARGIELSGAEAASLASPPELPVTLEGGTTDAGTVSTPATLGELGDRADWT